MSNSLQDQLLKAGLVDKKMAKQAAKDKQKQKKIQGKSKAIAVDEAKQAALDAQRTKVEKDRQLNAERQAKIHKKAIDAQIKQLIETHKLDYGKGEIKFSFKDGKTIKQLAVAPATHQKLMAGVLCIAKWNDKNFILPEVIATKIAQRDASYIVYQATLDTEQVSDDDTYADYQIPDDLMW